MKDAIKHLIIKDIKLSFNELEVANEGVSDW